MPAAGVAVNHAWAAVSWPRIVKTPAPLVHAPDVDTVLATHDAPTGEHVSLKPHEKTVIGAPVLLVVQYPTESHDVVHDDEAQQ